MMVFKRKQIVILSLVLMILIAGYLQYNYNQSSSNESSESNSQIGDAVYVGNKDVTGSEQKPTKQDSTSKQTSASTQVSASKQTNDYFSQTKMDRELVRSKDIETMKAITVDATVSKDAKTKANERMVKISEANDREMRVEALIKERGFNDAIALFADDGSIDIIVKTPSLTTAQVAQISDAVSRQANLEISKIHIKPLF